MSEVERARNVLEQEREAVIAALRDAGHEAREAADRQKAWRTRVQELLNRGGSAGIPVAEMAKALGLSRQWTTHLANADRQKGIQRLTEAAQARAARDMLSRPGRPRRKGRGAA